MPTRKPSSAAKPQPSDAVDDEPLDLSGLSPRRRLFVAALVGPAAGNATRAAMMAGYSPKNVNAAAVSASRLLRNAKVHEAVAHGLAAQRADPAWCRNRIIELAAANMNHFISIDAGGKVEIDFKRAEACGALGQIKEITPRWEPGKDGKPPTLIEVKVKLFDPLPALRLLAHMYGMLRGGYDTGKPPEDVWFDTAGQFAEMMPDGALPPMPDDVFAMPRVQGRSMN